MSELKVYHCNEWHNEYTEFYLESDVDKVLAELIEKNERLSNDCLIKASNTFREIEKEIRHHKYKRCLAMAKWCSERIARIEKDYAFWRHGKDYASNFYKRWRNRWLELAEKFKNKEEK
jgi:hypothetical protein